jgi:hypothetical protein
MKCLIFSSEKNEVPLYFFRKTCCAALSVQKKNEVPPYFFRKKQAPHYLFKNKSAFLSEEIRRCLIFF